MSSQQELRERKDEQIRITQQVANTNWFFLPLVWTRNRVDPASPVFNWQFRFPNYIYNLRLPNSLYQMELVQSSVVRTATGGNRPIFLFVDFKTGDTQTPFLSVIGGSSSPDSMSFPQISFVPLEQRAFRVNLSYFPDNDGFIINSGPPAGQENIEELYLTFKYSIKPL